MLFISSFAIFQYLIKFSLGETTSQLKSVINCTQSHFFVINLSTANNEGKPHFDSVLVLVSG